MCPPPLAPACVAYSYAIAIKYAPWKTQARGMVGTWGKVLCSNPSAMVDAHLRCRWILLLIHSASSCSMNWKCTSVWITCGWCVLETCESKEQCRWFLPAGITGIVWAPGQRGGGIKHLHNTRRYDKASWNLISPRLRWPTYPSNISSRWPPHEKDQILWKIIQG